jgi:hypothetical protein
LHDLRIEVDALLDFLQSDSKEEAVDEARACEAASRSVRGRMTRDQKQDLVRLIQTMLIEIVDDDDSTDEDREGGDDKDHA